RLPAALHCADISKRYLQNDTPCFESSRPSQPVRSPPTDSAEPPKYARNGPFGRNTLGLSVSLLARRTPIWPPVSRGLFWYLVFPSQAAFPVINGLTCWRPAKTPPAIIDKLNAAINAGRRSRNYTPLVKIGCRSEAPDPQELRSILLAEA